MSETTDNTNATPVVKAKDIKDSDIIIVKSLVSSVHYTCPKTLDSFSWAEVGDTNEMTFAQLKVMKTKHNGYFTKKWLYPQNDAALKKLGIDTIFAVKFEKRDMKLLYGNDVEAVKEKISYVPTVDRPAMVDKIEKAVKQGKIVNIKIIRLLEKEFGIDLMDLV